MHWHLESGVSLPSHHSLQSITKNCIFSRIIHEKIWAKALKSFKYRTYTNSNMTSANQSFQRPRYNGYIIWVNWPFNWNGVKPVCTDLCAGWCAPPCPSCSRSTSYRIRTGTAWWRRAAPSASSGCVCGRTSCRRSCRSEAARPCESACGSSGSKASVTSSRRCRTQTLFWCVTTKSCDSYRRTPSHRCSVWPRVWRWAPAGSSAACVGWGGRGARRRTGTPYCTAAGTHTHRGEKLLW